MSAPVEKFSVFAAPAVFVVLWASGFIGAKFGLPYAEPLTFLTLRMLFVGLLIGIVIVLTRPPWPNREGVLHSAVTGVFVHGLYLGGVFVALQQHLPDCQQRHEERDVVTPAQPLQGLRRFGR